MGLFSAIALIIIVIASLVLHETGHWLAFRHVGIRVSEVGFGIKTSWLPALKFKCKKYFDGITFSVNPLFLLGAYVLVPEKENKKLDEFPYKDAALCNGAGLLGNIIFAIALFSAAFLIGYCPKNYWFVAIAAASCAVISALVIFSKILCAYVLPFLGPTAVGLAIYVSINYSSMAASAPTTGIFVSARGNVAMWLNLGGLISLFLAAVNILPLPTCDGMKIVKLAWKKLRQ